MRRPVSRLAWMSLLISPPILPFLLPLAVTLADPVNITVDDTSSSLVYSPASSWHASTVPCSTCLAPNTSIAFKGTWHDGTHIIPTVDSDDVPDSSAVRSKGHGKGKDNDDDDSGSGSDEDGDESSSSSSTTTPTANPFFIPNFDSDDAGFKDQLVSAQFNFTGSAVYVYALIPLGAAKANSTPTFMNLTFMVDSHPAGTYQHTGTDSAAGFLPSQLVFGQTGLTEAPHSLTVQVGPDSVLLLDYVVYTQGSLAEAGSGSNSTSVSSSSSAPGSQKTSSGTGSSAPSVGPGTTKLSSTQSKTHNIATFAGAVGGSVGLLAVLALSLAISIYRRRLRAERRDRRYRRSQNRSDPEFDSESFHTDGSEDSPPMQGPAPFVPRYFPGTVVPAPPPPYSPPDATIALLSSTSPVPWAPPRTPAPGEDTSYADRPPPTPPPLPEDGMDDYFAPPSFPAAISSPIPAILAGYSPVPTTSAPVSMSPVPLHPNGSGSRGVYATDQHPPRSRANSDAQSERSGYSDRPPSFASQAPPLIPFSQQDRGGRVDGEGEQSRQRTSDEDRASVRSARSR
ncbi:hypothetical protein L226DRAFT_354197 [Lentinus tigrinus ALCF2SS1-7]|uniref:uncharacterized protein n=1 Tax=Lentinus tigrinus ALCF2SS1-7 TaxID=1328758 RepID=UPI001165EFEE|nr:hypothetical protein L226DRAFT_354197 [Lentinus tigrinus ALCF2SS1-7]